MVTADQRRAAVRHACSSVAISERRACRFLRVSRSSVRLESRRPPCTAERERLRAHAAQRPRWGYRFLHVLLRREGFQINHKRTYRLYREERLGLRRRRRRRASVPRQAHPLPGGPNERWSMDFISDTLASGRRFRALTIVDDYTRECPAIEVDTSLPAERVIEVLERVCAERGCFPEIIVVDNGPEFVSHALDRWAYARGVQLLHIEPGKPVQNAFIESFNGTLRENCLSQHWFTGLADARRIIEEFRIDYNTVRPHSSLGNRTPAEFAASLSVASAPDGASAFEHSRCSEETSTIITDVTSPQPAGLT